MKRLRRGINLLWVSISLITLPIVLVSCAQSKNTSRCYYEVGFETGSTSVNFQRSVSVNDVQIASDFTWGTSTYDKEFVYINNSCDLEEAKRFLTEVFGNEAISITPVTEVVYHEAMEIRGS